MALQFHCRFQDQSLLLYLGPKTAQATFPYMLPFFPGFTTKYMKYLENNKYGTKIAYRRKQKLNNS